MALSHAELTSAARCMALRYGEMAIALYADPSLPFPERPKLSPQELAAHAARGITRLGGVERVRSLYVELHEANRALLGNRIDVALYEVMVAALLTRAHTEAPDPDRFNRCIAYDYGRQRAA